MAARRREARAVGFGSGGGGGGGGAGCARTHSCGHPRSCSGCAKCTGTRGSAGTPTARRGTGGGRGGSSERTGLVAPGAHSRNKNSTASSPFRGAAACHARAELARTGGAHGGARDGPTGAAAGQPPHSRERVPRSETCARRASALKPWKQDTNRQRVGRRHSPSWKGMRGTHERVYSFSRHFFGDFRRAPPAPPPAPPRRRRSPRRACRQPSDL